MNVYFTNLGTLAKDYSDGSVMKVPATGGTPTAIASGQQQPVAIAVDGASVYWLNSGTAANKYADGTVMKLTPK